MFGYVAGRKMPLSKLLFIALMGIMVIVMRANAQGGPGEEGVDMAEGEGNAVMPGGADGGQDMVAESVAANEPNRSMIQSSRPPPSLTQRPSKAQRSNKLRVVILISIILIIILVVGGTVGYFVGKPIYQRHQLAKFNKLVKEHLPEGLELKNQAKGDDEKKYEFVTRTGAFTEAQRQKQVVTLIGFLTQIPAGVVWKEGHDLHVQVGTEAQRKAQFEAVPTIKETGVDYKDEGAYIKVLTNLVVGGEFCGKTVQSGFVFGDFAKSVEGQTRPNMKVRLEEMKVTLEAAT